METLTKEIVALDYLYGILYGMDEELFIECLKEELEDERIKNIIVSSAENQGNLFEEPFDVQKIKRCINKAHKLFKSVYNRTQSELFEVLSVFEESEFLKEYFSSDVIKFNLNIDNESVCIEEYSDTVLRKITFKNAEVYRNGNRINEGTVEIDYDIIHSAFCDTSYNIEFIEYFNEVCYQIKFSDVSVLLKPYNALDESFRWFPLGSLSFLANNPWLYLSSIAGNINAHFTYRVANQKEKEISGLIRFLAGVEFEDLDYIPSQLYHLIEKHNLKNKIKPPYDLFKRYLCKKKYEPFWREIFNLIAESQTELPSYFEENVSENDKAEHKRLITQQMNQKGYEGEYPDYYKKDSVIKPTLIRAYGLSYVVSFEKNTEHHIHCESVIENGIINTAFLIGTSFNKRGEDKTDIYSTMFDCNGKAVFSIISTLNAEDMFENTYKDLTTKAVSAAVRKADLKKAEKDDIQFKNCLTRFPKLDVKTLLLIFVMFSVGFSLTVPLVLLFVDGSTLSEVIAFMKDYPLFNLFGMFGGLLTTLLIALIEWKSAKK